MCILGFSKWDNIITCFTEFFKEIELPALTVEHTTIKERIKQNFSVSYVPRLCVISDFQTSKSSN